MNRMEEYQNLMQELDRPVPRLEHTLDRAIARNARRKRIARPLFSFAAAFACFVLLVNFCTPIAYACSKVPFLKELAEAVTFSRSLTDAVDHQYVQPLHLRQTDNGVTATVEYLIVDQKQVNVFYRLDSDTYTHMSPEPSILKADGSRPVSCSYSVNDWDVPNGRLQSVTIDFLDTDVPDSMRMQLRITEQGAPEEESLVPAEEADTDPLLEDMEYEPNYIAAFDFFLKFDPEFTAAGRTIPIGRTIVLNGQNITLTDMEIYPTHLRLNVEDDPDNTAWLTRLDFYIETDWGMKFEPVANGIIATGTVDSPMMASYRADSSYFYEAKHLKVVITGAEWLDKDMEKVRLDLKTKEIERLPEGVALISAEKKGESWIIHFQVRRRNPHHSHQAFSNVYFDPYGNEYTIDSWATSFSDENAEEEEPGEYFYETFPLKNYPYDEVWLCPHYTDEWFAEEPVAITAQ